MAEMRFKSSDFAVSFSIKKIHAPFYNFVLMIIKRTTLPEELYFKSYN